MRVCVGACTDARHTHNRLSKASSPAVHHADSSSISEQFGNGLLTKSVISRKGKSARKMGSDSGVASDVVGMVKKRERRRQRANKDRIVERLMFVNEKK